jgi:hypothetical protein
MGKTTRASSIDATNGAVMWGEAKHPATSDGKIVRPKLSMRFGISWVLRFAQNDI